MAAGLAFIAASIVARVLALALHEASHALVALLLGFRNITFHVTPFHLSVQVPGVRGYKWAGQLVRHSGWVVSVALALALGGISSSLAVVAAFGYTAIEAVASDLLNLTAPHASASSELFYCGNFGLIMLDELHRRHVLPILRLMMRTTMVRGAQSAGVVTYYRPIENRGWGGRDRVHLAQRTRKVNGKRTDLCDLLLGKEGTSPSGTVACDGGPQLFSGHTRFATSSQATLDGCHPHRWSPGVWAVAWRYSDEMGKFEGVRACVEAYVTHNGDLDYFTIHEHEYALAELQVMLPRVLHRPLPGLTDSCCLAGLFELHRTQGTWLPSVRYALIYGALNLSIPGASMMHPEHLWTASQLEGLTAIFEATWKEVLKAEATREVTPLSSNGTSPANTSRGAALHRRPTTLFKQRTSSDLAEADEPHTPTRLKRRNSLAVLKPVSELEAPAAAMATAPDVAKGQPASALQQPAHASIYNHDEDVRRQKKTVAAEEAAATREGKLGSRLGEAMKQKLLEKLDTLQARLDLELMVARVCEHVLTPAEITAQTMRFVEVGVNAFFTNDLMMAGRDLLRHAKGSFGVVLSHTLDCAHSTVIAARGQTMSVAFYPNVGMVLFGSEQAATKAAMRQDATVAAEGANPKPPTKRRWWRPHRASLEDQLAMDCSKSGEAFDMLTNQLKGSFRLDLDDLGGEIVLVTWGTGSDAEAAALDSGKPRPMLQTSAFLERRLYRASDTAYCEAISHVINTAHCRCDIISLQESKHKLRKPFIQRVLRLDGNDLVQPLLPLVKDPVGQDLADIPRVLKRLKADFADVSSSHNLAPAWNFSLKLKKRVMMHENGKHDGSVDLLVTGCEVSLWCGEQFASDLHLIFPRLKIVTLSANKLLGMLGQGFPIPQEGFPFNGSSYSLKGSIVLLVSATGGTFATLGVSNLLKAVTSELFTVTSEWDTQVARAVREGGGSLHGKKNIFGLYNFSTFAGFRPAEPSTVSLVATHTLLTHLLAFTMNHHSANKAGGSSYELQEVQELNGFHDHHIQAVCAILGRDTEGRAAPTDASVTMRRQGRRWAQHILEGPITWIISALYIAITVITGATPLSLLEALFIGESPPAAEPSCNTTGQTTTLPPIHLVVYYVRATVDALLYIFLPIWTAWLLRLVQQRHVLHRVAGRSLLIGDVPWVAQSVEAYVSKLFALSYSIATISVASGNAVDHLVHRYTHRVVRGSLLAVGRPDARLNALTSADSATCLSVSQACAINNLNANCEAITLGHHANKLQMTEACLVLPTIRQKFLCELLLEKDSSPLMAMRESTGGAIGTLDDSRSFRVPGLNKYATYKLPHDVERERTRKPGGRATMDCSAHSANSGDGDSVCSSPFASRQIRNAASMDISNASTTHGGSQHGRSPAQRRSPFHPRPPSESSSVLGLADAPVRTHDDSQHGNGSGKSDGGKSESDGGPSPSATWVPLGGKSFKRAALQQQAARRFNTAQNPMTLMSKLNQLKTGLASLPSRLETSQDETLQNTLSASLSASRARMTISELPEPFIGAWMQHAPRYKGMTSAQMSDRQRQLQTLYETRFASLQRLVGFFVIFHEMGKAVQDFWPWVSFGLLGYDMSRSQSMLRVATTASPISGSEVRERILVLEEEEMMNWAAKRIQRATRFVQMLQRHGGRGLSGDATSAIFAQAISTERQAGRGRGVSSDTMLAAEMVADLPDHYLRSTTIDERQVHLDLFGKYKEACARKGAQPRERVVIHWERCDDGDVSAYFVFPDHPGSLSTITTWLSARSVNILRVAAFTTKGGVAVDSFQLSSDFDNAVAESVVENLTRQVAANEIGSMSFTKTLEKLVSELPDHYVQSTELVERQAHSVLYDQFCLNLHDSSSSAEAVFCSWTNARAHEPVTMYLVFRDILGSLSIILTTLKECHIDVRHVSAFCTKGGVAIDTFQLTGKFSDVVVGSLKMRLSNEIAQQRDPGDTDAATLISELPDYYILATTQRERLAHRSLYVQLRSSGKRVAITWVKAEKSTNFHVYMVFTDVVGSLSAITAAFAECGVNVVRVAAFATKSSMAVDSFELDKFDEQVATLLQARLEELIEGSMAAGEKILHTVAKTFVSAKLSFRSWASSASPPTSAPELPIQRPRRATTEDMSQSSTLSHRNRRPRTASAEDMTQRKPDTAALAATVRTQRLAREDILEQDSTSSLEV